MKPNTTLRLFLAVIGVSIIAISPASAADGTWNQTAAGSYSWDTAGNWVSNTIADGTDNTATFGNISGAQTVTIDTARTIGNIEYTGTNNFTLTIGGAEALTMAVTSGIPTIHTPNRRMIITSGLQGNQGLLTTGNERLQFDTTTPTFTGGLTLGGGQTVLNVAMTSIGGAGSTITVTANSQLEMSGGHATNLDNNIHINDNVTFTHRRGQNNTTTIKGVVSGGDTTTLRVTDAGGTFGRALILENTANTFTGAIDLTQNRSGIIVGSLPDSVGAGNINFGGNDGGFALGTTAIAPMVINNRQFTMTAGNGTVRIENRNTNAANTLTINSDLLLTGATGTKTLQLGGANTGMNTFAGDIGNAFATFNLTKADAGTWVLSGDNSYNGTTTINAGRLEIGGSGTLGNVSPGVGDYAGNISIASTNSGRLVYNSTSNQTLGGVISGAGALFVENGTLTLTNAANSYNGATTINNGTLAVTGAGSINSSSGVTIDGAGATLLYSSSTDFDAPLTFTNGTVAGTNWNGNLSGLVIGEFHTISPGNSPGTANTVDQTWAAGGTYLWEINDASAIAGSDPGWDLLLGTGALDITATSGSPFAINITSLDLANNPGDAVNFDPNANYNWLIAQFGTAVSGFDPSAFTLNTLGFSNDFTGGTFGIALGGTNGLQGDDSQIYLTYLGIPEPSRAILFALGLAALFGRRRR